MKILVLFANTLVQLAAAVFFGFTMLIGLNGYSEKQATPGLILYGILAVLSVPGVGAAAYWTTGRLAEKTPLGNFGAGAVSFLMYVGVGCAILFGVMLASVFFIEALRNK